MRDLSCDEVPLRAGQSRTRSFGRLVVVYHGDSRFGPRARRVAAIESVLAREWDVLRGPSEAQASTTGAAPSPVDARLPQAAAIRKVARSVVANVLVDRYELQSLRRFRDWSTEADGALLIGAPFSPVFAAARRLIKLNVPYVVDVGDPLTLKPVDAYVPPVQRLARARAAQAETALWRHAAGAVVTSRAFGAALTAAFPHLDVLVRPNGYDPVPPAGPRTPRSDGVLRLVHFGSLYGARIDPFVFLRTLERLGDWERVTLDQYGPVWGYETAGEGVALAVHPELPWPEAVRRAASYDAALVIGNKSGLGPMSKVFSYQTLPIPRIALVGDVRTDETAAYVARLPGWLATDGSDAASVSQVANHVARSWSSDELAPEPADAWPAVAQEVASFVSAALQRARA